VENILQVKHLNVDIDGQAILRDLNFDVVERGTLVILGPNGAGKTVLLRALLGLLPYRGEVLWKKGIRIGYVPQRVPFNKDFPLTAADFFALKGISQQKSEDALRHVGLTENTFWRHQMGTLSSGQFQRVLIAWALADHPDVLLFDEPMAGIDVLGEETVYSLLQRTQAERNMTVFLVTHDLSIVYSKATNVLCLNNKTMLCHGSPKEVLSPAVLQNVFGREMKYYIHTHP
jgi:zinc transport system ATP-binding protein